MKNKVRIKIKPTKVQSKEKYSVRLIQEINEAKEDYKKGKYFKGTADEVIKNLHNEIDQYPL